MSEEVFGFLNDACLYFIAKSFQNITYILTWRMWRIFRSTLSSLPSSTRLYYFFNLFCKPSFTDLWRFCNVVFPALYSLILDSHGIPSLFYFRFTSSEHQHNNYCSIELLDANCSSHCEATMLAASSFFTICVLVVLFAWTMCTTIIVKNGNVLFLFYRPGSVFPLHYWVFYTVCRYFVPFGARNLLFCR